MKDGKNGIILYCSKFITAKSARKLESGGNTGFDNELGI